MELHVELGDALPGDVGPRNRAEQREDRRERLAFRQACSTAMRSSPVRRL
jgi:hypothetical protein